MLALHALLALLFVGAHAVTSPSLCNGGFDAATGDCIVAHSPVCLNGSRVNCSLSSPGHLFVRANVSIACDAPCFKPTECLSEIVLKFDAGITLEAGAEGVRLDLNGERAQCPFLCCEAGMVNEAELVRRHGCGLKSWWA